MSTDLGLPQVNSPSVIYIVTVASHPVQNALLSYTQTQCPDTYLNYCTYYRTKHHGCTYFLNNIAQCRGRRRKQLLDDLKETRGYCKLKEEALDRTVWRPGFGRGCGRVVRQATEWMNE